MAAEFKIVASADLDGAVKSVNDFVKTTEKGLASVDKAAFETTKEFKRLDVELSKKRNPVALSAVERGVKSLATTLSTTIPPAAAKAAAGITKVEKAVVNANPALTNFGRVIQDAPFGIIGIANNIDPLIESFQRLKTQTGSAGSAFKALGSALLGPAGIAIAVSAVTSALIAFGPQIKDIINGVSKFEGALRTASEEGTKAFIGAQQEFDKFSGTLNNANASLNQQNVALKGVNGLLSEYGLEIKSVSDFQKVGNQVGLIYAQIKANEAKATAIASVAAEEYAENIKRLSGTTKAVTSIASGGFFSQLFEFAKLGPGGLLALGGSLDKIGKSGELQKTLNNETSKFRTENDALIKSLENIGGVTVKTNAGKKAAIAVTEEETKAQKENAAFLSQVLTLKKADLTVLKATTEEINAAVLALKSRNREQALSQFGAGLGPETLQPFDATSLFDNAATEAYIRNLNAADEATKTAVDSINAAIFSLAVDSLASFAETLGTALVTGDIAGGIKRFAGVLGGAVSALGKQVLITSKVMVALQKALATGSFIGPLGIVAGLGLIAAGAALSSLANGGLKLARGGVINSPTSTILGDGGPEVAIPLSQLANIIGGVALQMPGGSGGGLSIVRGQDIYYSNNNASRSFGRLFG